MSQDKVHHVPKSDMYYDPETGKLFRIKEYKCTSNDGTINTIYYNGSNKQATHVMFFIMTGRWPAKGILIDHKDGDPYNNNWANLREATHKQNSQNTRSRGRWYNAHLPRGIYMSGSRFKVVVDTISFGSYSTLEEATTVMLRERQCLQGEFARSSGFKRRI